MSFRSALILLAVALQSACSSGSAVPAAGISVTLKVVPGTADVAPSQTVQFAAQVTGTANTSVTWSVIQAGGGTITGGGLYTAPASTGTYQVRAVSNAVPSVGDQATVTVTLTPSVSIAVTPSTATLSAGALQTFTALVTGTANVAVSWSVLEGAAGGAITAAGAYTAPAVPGTYHVVATSVADPTKSATATVLVNAAGGTCGTDTCPAPHGVAWNCETRFVFGANWAWRGFGGDFGGHAAWGQSGVAANAAAVSAEMADMKAAGVSVIRWWMFPHLQSDGIAWGTDGFPSGIKGTMVADIQKALELADKNGVYLHLTLFSFDSFGTANPPSINPMVTQTTGRTKLLANLIAPVAAAVEASPYKKRMLAWDMINEPEWAISGASLYGDPPFEPDANLQTVTHTQMQTFLVELAATLRANSGALVSIGGAAIKWPKAWIGVNVDFYQYHYYNWVYEWFPYTTVTLASVGMTSKPVVMGEFPIDGLAAVPTKGLPARSASQLSADLWTQGYAGALPWAYNDPAFTWLPAEITTFSSSHACEATY